MPTANILSIIIVYQGLQLAGPIFISRVYLILCMHMPCRTALRGCLFPKVALLELAFHIAKYMEDHMIAAVMHPAAGQLVDRAR